MILETFINILIGIIKVIFGIVRAVISPIEAPIQLLVMLAKIISICTQANNFIHFIVGDFVVVLVPLTIALLGIKYTIYPVVQFMRSFVSNSNN